MRKCEALPLPTSCRCHHPMNEWMTTTLHITTLLALCKPTNHQINRQTVQQIKAFAFAPPNGSMPQSVSGFEVFSHGSRRSSTQYESIHILRENVVVVVVVVIYAYTHNHIYTYALRIRTSAGLRSLLHCWESPSRRTLTMKHFCFKVFMLISLAC